MERAENTARFLEVTLNLILDQPENLVDPWKPLVQVTADEKWFAEHYGVANQANVVQFLAFDKDYSNSMVSCLRHARENARGVREMMSSEAFEQLNEFYHFVIESSHDAALNPTSHFFDEVRRHTLMWSGVLHATMEQDTAWHFANVGRMLERADKTSRILDVKYFNLLPDKELVGTAIDDLQWTALLLAVSGFEAYQRDHHHIQIEKVVDFFLFNRRFPRSVRHCVASAGWSLDEINEGCESAPKPPSGDPHLGPTSPAPDGPYAPEDRSASDREDQQESDSLTAVKLVGSLRHRLAHTTVKEAIAGGMHEFVDSLQTDLNRIGDAVAADYFQTELTS